MGYTWKNGSHLEKGPRLEKWVTLGRKIDPFSLSVILFQVLPIFPYLTQFTLSKV